MALLSSFYPQPVVAGTTAGTYVAGNDSRLTDLSTGSTVVSDGSGTARSLSERFSEITNVKDFGATGDGITDDWLAIQRAIAAAANHPTHGQNVMSKNVPANTETTLTSGTTDTFDYGGKTIPQLFYVDSAAHIVYFPAGTYRISRPIIIGSGTQLRGELGVSGTIIAPVVGTKGTFNLIESWFVWLNRTQCENNIPYQIVAGYDANVSIENIELRNNLNSPYASTPVLVNGISWYRMPLMTSGSGSTFNATADATAGNNYFTPIGSSFSHKYYPNQKIKFSNHSTVYTYVSRTNNQIFVTPNITQNVSGANVLIGLPANNGIMINGGENSKITRVQISSCEGAGIFVCGGTPSPVVSNCMVNWCDVAYWMEGGTNVLMQPSGDGNNTFLRSGYLFGSGLTTTMIGCKVEGKHDSSVAAGTPYPSASDARSGIELANYGAVSCLFNFIGGSWNYHGASAIWGQTNAKNHQFMVCYRESYMPRIYVQGMKQGGFRETFYKQVSIWDPSGTTYGIDRLLKRRWPQDYEDMVTIQGTASFDYVDELDFDRTVGVKLNHRISTPNSGLSPFAFYGDQGSGFFDGVASFSRSGTTATFTTYASDGVTLTNHNLQVGDQVRLVYPNGVTPLTLDSNPENRGTYGSLYVKTASGSTFTVTVADSGGTSGSGLRLQCAKFYWLHGILNNEHIIQMPLDLGESGAGRALTIRDKQNRHQAGLRVATANEGDWWASKSLNMGGTIDSPASRILYGADAPSASAPDGSIYLRTNGTADTTLYVRAGGAWTALTST